MPRSQTSPSAPRTARNRRGSPEAIEKRRVARLFNVQVGEQAGKQRDGRTEKRRLRLLDELKKGEARGHVLKPLDVLERIQELLTLGETTIAIRKARPFPRPLPPSPELTKLVKRLHAAYAFRPEAYRFVGITETVLNNAGVLTGQTRKTIGTSTRNTRK